MLASMAMPAVAFAEETTDTQAVEATAENTESTGVKRAILDTDMSYLNDDAIVMFMLAQADKMGDCDFLGVTTVGGNTWSAVGTTAALRQLELIGRSDIPVLYGELMYRLWDSVIWKQKARFGGMPEYSGAYWNFNEVVLEMYHSALRIIRISQLNPNMDMQRQKHRTNMLLISLLNRFTSILEK